MKGAVKKPLNENVNVHILLEKKGFAWLLHCKLDGTKSAECTFPCKSSKPDVIDGYKISFNSLIQRTIMHGVTFIKVFVGLKGKTTLRSAVLQKVLKFLVRP